MSETKEKAPTVLINFLVQELATLSCASNCSYTTTNFNFIFDCSWEEDKHPTISNIHVELNESVSPELSEYITLEEDLVINDYEDELYKSPEVVEIATQIKFVCDLAELLEKNFDFDWDRDVLNITPPTTTTKKKSRK